MDPALEIRKLPLSHKPELITLLELHQSWKKLMAIIPKSLTADYRCDVSVNNPAKYCSEDFRTIEHAAEKHNRVCSDILLQEWGNSGRVRPALGHLKYLLEKAQLYKAADYVCVNLLQQERPIRPNQGPAARVTFNFDEVEDSEIKKVEEILDAIDYPSSAIAAIDRLNSIDRNLNQTDSVQTIPKIIVSESPDDDAQKSVFNIPLVVQKSESDLMQFSSDNANVPQLSSLLGSCSNSSNSSSISSEVSDAANRPQLSSLLNSDSQNFNIPMVSGLNLTETNSNLPALSDLIETKSSRSCSSPLPNLSLDTPLPHIPYKDIEIATNHFDETAVDQGGCFLGSGAFGKVFLAQDLFKKPVAVKIAILGDVEEVKVDDTVTKQFINEVEILSKHKHENLVSLLGYSCDGMSYCLLYEYVPGGALKERLQKHELIWTERLYVAFGTSRALSYLHTAYSTPLIHRDVKSANILLDLNNKPKLCDFGLIKRALNHTTLATTVIGSSAYMAPEAIRGDISVKLDTFSFGVVLLELLTSLPPLDHNRDGVDLITHVRGLCKEGISPLLDKMPGSWTANQVDFAGKLYQVARDCLKEKEERPTMVQVSDWLEKLIEKAM